MIGTQLCIQVNLHNAIAATALLKKRFVDQKFSIGFIQEPWTAGNQIKGLANRSCKLIYSGNTPGRPRAALLFNNNVSFFPLTEYITKDIVAVVVDIRTERGCQKVVH